MGDPLPSPDVPEALGEAPSGLLPWAQGSEVPFPGPLLYTKRPCKEREAGRQLPGEWCACMCKAEHTCAAGKNSVLVCVQGRT